MVLYIPKIKLVPFLEASADCQLRAPPDHPSGRFIGTTGTHFRYQSSDTDRNCLTARMIECVK